MIAAPIIPTFRMWLLLGNCELIIKKNELKYIDFFFLDRGTDYSQGEGPCQVNFAVKAVI
jgi:hypothetical protein